MLLELLQLVVHQRRSAHHSSNFLRNYGRRFVSLSVVLSGMRVLSGGWFLLRIGISTVHATLCFVREIQTIIEASVCIRCVFPVLNKG